MANSGRPTRWPRNSQNWLRSNVISDLSCFGILAAPPIPSARFLSDAAISGRDGERRAVPSARKKQSPPAPKSRRIVNEFDNGLFVFSLCVVGPICVFGCVFRALDVTPEKWTFRLSARRAGCGRVHALPRRMKTNWCSLPQKNEPANFDERLLPPRVMRMVPPDFSLRDLGLDLLHAKLTFSAFMIILHGMWEKTWYFHERDDYYNWFFVPNKQIWKLICINWRCNQDLFCGLFNSCT